jgi:tRNA threonylcarbamoyladenosine biosynthesis protein TsaE
MSGAPAPAADPRSGEGWSVTAATASAAETRALAAAVAGLARPGDVVLLVGGLGAGKTTFAQGFARGLGVEGPVTSPTFTLVRQYRCRGPVHQLLHADVYRLDTVAEVADLGLAELVEDGAVALVEWGDAAAPALGGDTLTVALWPGDEDEVRRVTVTGQGAVWDGRREKLEAMLSPFGGAAR